MRNQGKQISKSLIAAGTLSLLLASPNFPAFQLKAFAETAAETSQSETDSLKDELKSYINSMDVEDPNQEVQDEFQQLVQLDAKDPYQEGDSLGDTETESYEFNGFETESDESSEEESEIEENESVEISDPDAVGEDSSLNLPSYDLSQSTITMASGAYCYSLPNGDRFYVSVPAGATTNGSVQMEFSSSMTGIYSLMVDGNEEYNVLKRSFSDPGSYELTLFAVNPDGTSTEDAGNMIPFRFTIQDSLLSEKNEISAPDGFVVRSVTLDGKTVAVAGSGFVPEEDGNYEIVFALRKNPDILYTYRVDYDTEAPELTFSKDITGGKVTGPLEFSIPQEECQIRVYKDFREVSVSDQTLTRGGDYRIQVTDQAGNTRTYSFVLTENPVKKILMAIGAAVVLAVGLGIYMTYIRRHMRIL